MSPNPELRKGGQGTETTKRHDPCYQADAFLEAGVALPPSVFEAWFVSAAHGGAELERIAAAAPSAARAAAAAPAPAARLAR